jgi:hypothetical protein
MLAVFLIPLILHVGCANDGEATGPGTTAPGSDQAPAAANDAAVPGPSADGPAATSGPNLSNALAQGCFGWPGTEFDEKNKAPIKSAMERGDLAVDFTLKDLKGQAHTLSELLKTKPVVLFLGSFTCPFYNGAKVVPKVNEFAARAFRGSSFGVQLHFVHVYSIEAHPQSPDPSPYFGRVKEAEKSSKRQATSYAERELAAQDIQSQLEGNQLLLVDAFETGKVNPVWCTYGTCPSCAFLIRQDGLIEAVHDWYDEPTFQGSIEAMFAE